MSFFRSGAISGMGMDGMGWDLCAGLFYEHRFAMLITEPISAWLVIVKFNI